MLFDVFGRAGRLMYEGDSDTEQVWTFKSIHDPTKTLKWQISVSVALLVRHIPLLV